MEAAAKGVDHKKKHEPLLKLLKQSIKEAEESPDRAALALSFSRFICCFILHLKMIKQRRLRVGM